MNPACPTDIDGFPKPSLTFAEVKPDHPLQPTNPSDPLSAPTNFGAFPAPQLDWNMQDLVWSNLPWDWNFMDDLLLESGDAVENE